MPYSWFIVIALFLASFTLGTAGFGFAMVSLSLISLVASPKLAVPFIMVYGYGVNFFLFLRFKEYIDWQKLWPLMVGALPGIPLGIYFLKTYEDVMIKKIVGNKNNENGSSNPSGGFVARRISYLGCSNIEQHFVDTLCASFR